MLASVGQNSKLSESDEDIHASYKAFLERRRARGELSLRTPPGFQRLQKRYQLPTNRVNTTESGAAKGDEALNNAGNDDAKMRSAVAVFFSSKIVQLISGTCWPLAHFGGGTTHTERECAGLELAKDKYSTFTFRLIQWVFPELPKREAQELAEYDWESDRKFDDVGANGLSRQSFQLSLIDLAIACTDGSVGKCLEFLHLMARWLQHSLPPYPTREIIPPVVEGFVKATKTLKPIPKPAPSIVWDTIPSCTMTPCLISPQGLFCELKTKVSPAPMAIMVLATDENPIELVLATNSKLLVNKYETRVNVYRKVTLNNALCGELKRQGCWTFCLNPNTPLVLLVQNASISSQTKALYGCFRAFDLGKSVEEVPAQEEKKESTGLASPANSNPTDSQPSTPNFDSEPPASSLVTLFTSFPEQCPLLFNYTSSVCYRMERMSTRMFTVDTTTLQDAPFSLTLTGALLQNTNSAGGPGAAAVVSSTLNAVSTFTVNDHEWVDPQKNEEMLGDAHTFVFILKAPAPVALKGNASKQPDATLPQQWFTSLNAANEAKTIVFESSTKPQTFTSKEVANDVGERSEGKTKESQRKEMYNIFIFTLHGVYIEVVCSATVPEQLTHPEEDNSKTQEREDEEEEKHNRISLNPETPITSALLLRELLLLQKMRQLKSTAEPPPDFVVGTSAGTAKPVTTAESLRTKVLRSRQDERRARYTQLEAAIRSKLLENKPRRPNVINKLEPESTGESADDPPLSPNSEFEKRVSLLTTFFHEMAVHQPRIDELHGSAAEAAEAVAEEQFLKRFGDIFDRDESLQNALDEEKWSTDTAKAIRRRSSMSTNLPSAVASASISGARDQIDEGKCTPWTLEDYENTAQYIEQLMVDIETHETQQQEQENLAAEERKRAVMDQLVASWQYTQHRVNRPATRERVRELEQKRRSQWMQSQHVQVYGDVAYARRSDKPERTALVLSKQRFLVQEKSLPLNAIWEVPGCPSNLSSDPIEAAGLVSPARMAHGTEKAHDGPQKLQPQRPPQRSMTVAATTRPSNILAQRSAAFSRSRVRRIRSAQSTPRDDLTPSRLQARRITTTESPRDLQPTQEVACISNIPTSPQLISSMVNGNHQVDLKRQAPDNAVNNLMCTLSLEIGPETSDVSVRLASPISHVNKAPLVETKSTRPSSRKRRQKKKRSTDLRFRRNVLELAAIYAHVRAATEEERKEAQGIKSIEELDSVPIHKAT